MIKTIQNTKCKENNISYVIKIAKYGAAAKGKAFQILLNMQIL